MVAMKSFENKLCQWAFLLCLSIVVQRRCSVTWLTVSHLRSAMSTAGFLERILFPCLEFTEDSSYRRCSREGFSRTPPPCSQLAQLLKKQMHIKMCCIAYAWFCYKDKKQTREVCVVMRRFRLNHCTNLICLCST